MKIERSNHFAVTSYSVLRRDWMGARAGWRLRVAGWARPTRGGFADVATHVGRLLPRSWQLDAEHVSKIVDVHRQVIVDG
jgi:hypothetical protein